MPLIDDVLNRKGLNPGGEAQKFFANEIARKSDSYVPMDAGILKNSVTIALDGTFIQYNVPYARVHWCGYVMVGSLPKKPTTIKMNYRGAPKRGPKWVMTMWETEQDAIIKSVQKFVDGK